MDKVDNVISKKEYNDDSVIYDNANNLHFLQTKIDELQNKLHTNKYFYRRNNTKISSL